MGDIPNSTFSRLLRIDSSQRLVGSDSITNFNVNLSRMTETNDVVRVVLKSVSFSNSMYNVEAPNDKFTVFVSNSTGFFTVTVPPGYYSTIQLMATLESLINPLLVPFSTALSFSQDPINSLVTAVSSLETFSILSQADQLSQTGFDSKLPGFLGFFADSPVPAASTTASKIPNLYGLTNCYLHCQQMAEGNVVDGDVENHDILAQVPVDVPYGQFLHYELNDELLGSINFASERNLDILDISLRDIDQNIIKLNTGDLTLLVKLYYL